ncbi:right-handed parallel beta-helix repeat-containing protein [Actinomadura graeca]|uniref:Right-handed parallel beta-helix repeat-containing protein n=1 Tax=Actinomadura graeca TaxID=2750812 RepID=A0ABX8R333_9ACTN|nr:right-handed parallel beta-helix repeat-containing protein [Actinomadura graeca]QXJ24367.1 right-handed parallel beta-helix repeat-containing protein [Actinomadura graeca]
MPHSSNRTTIVRVLALPVIVSVGFLGWQIPRQDGKAPVSSLPARPGAAPVGSTSYKVPDGAVFVSPSGDDGAQGTRKHPLRTLGRAIGKAPAGGTIVLRGGVYHESVTVPRGKRLTIQSHPREAVWFDGSSRVSGWAAEGDAWVHGGWTARFDSSPTYTPGARPSSDVDFQFVSPRHPMASHPDQLWLDGAPQKQVGSRDEVGPGTFYVDEGGSRLYVGSDPRGHDVRASTLGKAITIDSEGSTLRGIGVRRYATSLPDIATVRATAPKITVENVVVTESATTGLTVVAAHGRVRHVTSSGNGLLGIHANTADDLRLEGVRLDHNNRERFKYSPVSGGFKITRSRKVAVVDSTVADNLGKGLWMDESVYDITITGSRILRNAHHGISLELSAKAVVAGNVISGNAGDGMKVNNTSDVRIWNNSMAGNGRAVFLVQDPRRRDDPGVPGRDPRQKGPDPAMTWRIGKTTVSNNTFADARPDTPCLLCVTDHTGERTAAQMNLTVNGNVYVRPDAANPRTLILWSRHSFADLGRFRTATGQETRGAFLGTATAARTEGDLEDAVAPGADANNAMPLPADIAELLGEPKGTRHIGSFSF